MEPFSPAIASVLEREELFQAMQDHEQLINDVHQSRQYKAFDERRRRYLILVKEFEALSDRHEQLRVAKLARDAYTEAYGRYAVVRGIQPFRDLMNETGKSAVFVTQLILFA